MRRHWHSDEGSAVVEFVFLSVLLMVPIVYLVLSLAAVQSGALAAEAVARDASRAAVVGGVDALRDGASAAAAEAAARERAANAATTTLGDFRVDDSAADVTLNCSTDPCLTPGSDMTVNVTVHVQLPVIGSLLPGATVSVNSSASSPVDGYLP